MWNNKIYSCNGMLISCSIENDVLLLLKHYVICVGFKNSHEINKKCGATEAK